MNSLRAVSKVVRCRNFATFLSKASTSAVTGYEKTAYLKGYRGIRTSTKNAIEAKTPYTVRETVDGNTITIESVPDEAFVSPEGLDKLLGLENPTGACPLCRLDAVISYTDVLILRQFMRPDGTVLPRPVTGLCTRQQQIVERCVMQAHWCGLFPDQKPPGYDPLIERSDYKAYNRFWDHHSEIYRKTLTEKPGAFYYIKRYNSHVE